MGSGHGAVLRRRTPGGRRQRLGRVAAAGGGPAAGGGAAGSSARASGGNAARPAPGAGFDHVVGVVLARGGVGRLVVGVLGRPGDRVDRLILAGWMARAQDDPEEAVRLIRAAAELEGTLEKHPVTPGALLPPYEALGDLLLELDRPAEALTGVTDPGDGVSAEACRRLLCDAGAYEVGLGYIHRATSKGYFAFAVLSQRGHFDPLRGDRDFQSVLTAAERGREQARAAFRAAEGERLLGVLQAVRR